MVVVFTVRHLKFKINQRDHNPPHVHVEGIGCSLRVDLITLEPVDARTGFSARAVGMILSYVNAHKHELLEQWELYHGKRD